MMSSPPSAESQVLSLCSTIGVSASAVDAGLVSRLVDVLKSEGCDVRTLVCLTEDKYVTLYSLVNLSSATCLTSCKYKVPQEGIP